MKKIIILSVLFLIFQSGFAQSDALLQEIEQADVDSTAILITKARLLLVNKFLKDDISKTAEIENYISKKLSNAAYIGLYPQEQWLVKYWTKDYINLIKNVKESDSSNILLSSKTQPKSDNLNQVLQEKSFLHKQEIITAIQNTALSDHDKDFLSMHFKFCLFSLENAEITQDTLNELADNFIKKYPNSELISYIRQNIRYEMKDLNWGYGGEYFSGYGFFSGQLNSHFTDFFIWGFGLEGSFKKVILNFRGNIGYSFTRYDYTKSNTSTWTQNSGVLVYAPELCLGYVVHEQKHTKLTPFIGVSAVDITPTTLDALENEDVYKYELAYTPAYMVGVNADFKFKLSWSDVSTHNSGENYFIRFRYACYLPQFSSKYSGFDGTMHTFTIGFGAFGKDRKRDL
jgi:hypothetical protein